MIIDKNIQVTISTQLLAAVIAATTISIGPLIFGFSSPGIVLGIFLSPLWISCIICIVRLHYIGKRKIRIEAEHLIVEDFSPPELPWAEILGFSTARQPLWRSGQVLWLKIHFTDDTKYAGHKWLHKANTALLGEGVPVCNLATYQGSVDEILNNLNDALLRYRK